MTQITAPQDCTGCQACRLICPKHCIRMAEDDEGFQVPEIDQTLCTDCGLCVSRCPQNTRPACTQNNCRKVLGARYKDDALLLKSASGGVFVGMAKKILETPGNAVFGCAFDENMVARHVCVTDFKDIEPLQSSKYVQSDAGDTYSQAKNFLEEGKTVFYTGTPCQIAGLYAFLGKNYDNLLTADLICHGVPSPLLFKRYIHRLGKNFGGKIIYYDFRNKEKHGWGIMTKTKTKTKTKTLIPYTDSYYNSFLENFTLRECCYRCHYGNPHRPADCTLGDFWGIENAHPAFFDIRGVSVVLVNTEKGENFFKGVAHGFEVLESTLDKAAQTNLTQPSPRPALRDTAYSNIQDESSAFNAPCYKINKKVILKNFIKKITPRFVIAAYKSIKKGIKH